tara:strand:- start:161 stop:355 length:195 start_codon:yes stop_codon:yes gene_type:complete
MKTVLLIVTGLSLGWGLSYMPDSLTEESKFTTVIDQAHLDNESTNMLWSVDLTDLELGVCYDER